MNVYLTSIGCRLNEAELQMWARQFSSVGWVLIKARDQADLIILNTCTVTAQAARKSRQTLRRLRKDRPDALIIVTGCYSALALESELIEAGADLIVANNEKERLTELVCARLDHQQTGQRIVDPLQTLFARGKDRAFVKIQDGCRYRCSFCIVTIARGDERSRSVDEVVDEIAHLSASGINEVVLTGVHVGGFGSDHGDTLPTLLKAILSATDIPRIRLSSLEPWGIGDELIECFHNPRIMPHLHLPLQSGSDSVLRRMARRIDTQGYRHLIDRFSVIPDMTFTTDIIVGFPGETDQEWQETVEYIESFSFSDIHIFPFSAREGTRAAEMDGRLNGRVIKARVHELEKLAAQLKQSEREKYLGREMPVMWESAVEEDEAGQHWCTGFTPNYLKVARLIGHEQSPGGRIEKVRLAGISSQQDWIEASCGSI